MELRVAELPPIGTNVYVLHDPDANRVVLFDAPMGASILIDSFLRETGAELEAVFLTHGHWDHMHDVAEFNARNIPVYANEGDREMIEAAEDVQGGFLPSGVELHSGRVDHWVNQGDKIQALGKEFEVRYVPGHSLGSIIFYLEEQKFAIVGDTVFQGSIGRTDLPGGNFAMLEAAIREQIYTLPDDTTLYPGHGPATNVAEEKANNPYVSG